MVSIEAFLRDVTAVRGLSGDECPVAERLAEYFRPLCDEVTVDAMQNMTARLGSRGPRVMIAAHLDEIGLMAMAVEDDGAIRFGSIGGVDPRILPASRVTVYTEEGPMTGVILAPQGGDEKKNHKMQSLFVDLGLAAERVKAIVHPGTPITLYGPATKLENNRLACKTIDDRGCVAMMLRAAELLQHTDLRCQALFTATSQEEVGGRGAQTGCWALDPDIGVAIDVTHGSMPGCDEGDTFPLEKIVMSEGPFITPALHKRMFEICKKLRVDAQTSVAADGTWTDADDLMMARVGVPTVLIELPLKYMHTTVETVSLDTIEEGARLLAAFLAELGEDWEAMFDA